MATNDFIVKNGLQVNENAAILETTDATSATDTAAALRTAGGAAVAKKLYVGTNLDVQGTSNLVGNVTVTGDVAANGGDVTTTAATATLFNSGATNLSIGGAATTVTVGATTGTTTVQNALTVNGALTASGASVAVALSPTGTGTVTISPAGGLTVNPATTGTINNTSIGASTRSTGAFTTLTSNGATTFTAGTASTSTATGTVVVTGGLGVSGRINAANIDGIIGANSAAAGSFTTLTANNAVTFTQNTGSTSTTTGTLVVTGGVGISERLYAGSIQNTPIGSSVANTAAFTTLTSNGATTFTAGTASTSTATGTVVVTGGMGLSGAVNAGASSTFAGLSSTSTTTLSPANASVTISPTGTGTVTIAPATAGTINNMSIGATTASTGRFSSVTMLGDITFNDDIEGIVWSRNTDGAFIKFYNTSDADTNSRLEFNINDNGDEDFLFSSTIGATTTELLRISPDGGQTGLKFRTNTVWHAGNDGSGSGLDADTVDGLHVNTDGRADNANEIVRTDGNGYIQAGWINTTSGDNGTTAIDRVYASNDGYIRYYTPTNFRAVLNVPTRTGGDASGTWAISVSGNAATATSATSATNSSYLSTYDDRIKAPADDDAGKVRFGFTSWGNNNSTPYADYLHMRSYTDASGGADNLVMFNKSGIGMRIWQQSWGSSSNYSNYKDVAFKDDVHYIGTTSIALNRSSAAQSLTGVNIDGSSGSCTGNSATVTNGVYTVGDQTIGGNKTFSGSTTIPDVFINRSGNTGSGISWYSSGYTSWCQYMAQQGQTSVGPTNNITAPTGVLVTSWALRSFVEESAGYGWTFEAGSSTGQPSTKVEIRSSDGSIYTRGGVYAAGDIYSSYSDLNLKDVVAPVENAVDKVMKIDTIYYKANETARELGIDTSDELKIGVTAQSVEAAEPLLVKPIMGHDKYNTVDYQRLTVLLIAAMKEQQKEIDMLKSKLGL